MERDRFLQVKQAFRRALALSPEERRMFVERKSADDPELAREVRELLRHAGEAAEFLERAPAGPPGAPPLEIPGYEIERLIAAGASGSVYRASQSSPRRDIAIKVLRADALVPGQVARFRREAQILADLDHPGIARVIETGFLENGSLGLPWIALEFVHGVTLDEHLQEAQLGLPALLELHAQVCAAVEHAHRRGIVHRDLKPSNVMVDRDGRPRVIDFGIARGGPGLDAEAALRTRTGMLVGTLGYMAPEQAQGERDLTPAADVYSLGAILYESLAGRPPIELEGLDLLDAVRAICDEEPLFLRRLRPDLPRDLETILAKSLEKDPRRRYASAGELGDELRRLLERRPVLARRATLAYRMHQLVRRNPALSISVAAVMVALATALGFAVVGMREARRESQRTAETLDTLVAKMLQFTSRLGFGEEQRGDLEAVLALVEEQLEREPASRELRAARAQLLTEIAVLDQVREDFAAMDRRIGEARSLWEALAGEAPDELAVATQVSAAYARSGEAAEALGRLDERDAWYARALANDERLVREHPGDLELVEDLGWSLERLARTAAERGEFEEAQRLDLRRLANAEALVRSEPRNWKFVYDLSSSHYWLAARRRALGEPESAAEHALECVRGARLLLEIQPARRDALKWIVYACRHARTLQLELGRMDAARQLASEALDRTCELLLAEPTRSQHLGLLRLVAEERVMVEPEGERAAAARATAEQLDRLASLAELAGSRGLAEAVRALQPTLIALGG